MFFKSMYLERLYCESASHAKNNTLKAFRVSKILFLHQIRYTSLGYFYTATAGFLLDRLGDGLLCESLRARRKILPTFVLGSSS
ncbi:Uncharacterised protein [Legionella cincinnatiensis]|uniref:Uncharacterized protein n=1 Tax=Legionella cincinnatiensis TaxID=28085 RepID=A0A378IID3_9GAMM|nr:hypothetical protein Lcin_0319 [Legionella cincinnatiensis]STX35018.1 Uncharacterised protein [Legionella cincinnatiensis]